MKFSQSLILSVPIARPGEKVPAANARVDVYCEHADRDGAAATHMRLAEALRPVLARWLVDESKVVALGEPLVSVEDTDDGNRRVLLHRKLMEVGQRSYWEECPPAGRAVPSWESEALRMADESGIDGDDDEVGE